MEKDFEVSAQLRYYYEHSNEINGVIIASDLIYRYYNLVSPNRRLSYTKDRLFMYTVVYYFPKQSPFEDLFNVKLQNLKDAGILSHYTAKYDDHKSKNYKPPQRFQMDSLFPILEICAIMYLISFVVFVLEIISTNYRRIKYCIDYLTY